MSAALRQAGYDSVLYDPAEAPASLGQAVIGCDVVFSALHGSGGEDGITQSQLERLGVRYVGSGVHSSELCFDKWNYRALLMSNNMPVAPGELVDDEHFKQSKLSEHPYVLKPPKGGSSIDTILARDVSHVDEAHLSRVLSEYRQMLLEKLIEGTELTVGVLGTQVLPIIEIIPPPGGEFDYENKYNGATQELCPPRNVDEKVQRAAQQLALKAHKLTGCRDFSRTDIMCDAMGNLFLLETNTIPGLTEQSLFPKMAATAGIPMSELCAQLVEMALKR